MVAGDVRAFAELMPFIAFAGHWALGGALGNLTSLTLRHNRPGPGSAHHIVSQLKYISFNLFSMEK